MQLIYKIQMGWMGKEVLTMHYTQYEDLTMKSKKIIWQTLGFMAPFILMSIADYSIPMFIDLTIRTSVLFYIHGAINQLIALCLGAFTFIVWRTSNPHTLASPTFPTEKASNINNNKLIQMIR